jgi:hypothetical protein
MNHESLRPAEEPLNCPNLVREGPVEHRETLGERAQRLTTTPVVGAQRN